MMNDDVRYRDTMGVIKQKHSDIFGGSQQFKDLPLLKTELPVKRYLIIIDDNLNQLKSYNSDLALFCTKSRHYNIVTIYTTQVFRRLPSTIRQNCDLQFCLYLTVSDDTFGEMFGKAKLKLFNQFYEDYVLKGPQYSLVCISTNPSKNNARNIIYEDGDTRERMWVTI